MLNDHDEHETLPNWLLNPSCHYTDKKQYSDNTYLQKTEMLNGIASISLIWIDAESVSSRNPTGLLKWFSRNWNSTNHNKTWLSTKAKPPKHTIPYA